MNFSNYCQGIDWGEAEENMLNIPVTWLDPNPDHAKLWNMAYLDTMRYEDIVPTRSGGISKAGINFRYYSRLLDISKSSMTLYIVTPDKCFALRFRDAYAREAGGDECLSGTVAFHKLLRMFKKEGFDFDSLAIPNGLEVKQTIEAPDIRMIPEFKDKIVENAFHVDIHSAYFAGVVKKFGHYGNGAVAYVGNYLYDHRNDGTKTTKYNKSIANCSVGFMQSRYDITAAPGETKKRGYSHAHIAKAAISDCKKTLAGIIKEYEKRGCTLIATNTDGAWLEPPADHRRERSFLEDVPGYGKKLGEFSIDHYDCLLRYRTRGAYEYIEDGIYEPVIRGRTRLDFIKPRTAWEWGDIYREQADVIRYRFHNEVGLYLSGSGEE